MQSFGIFIKRTNYFPPFSYWQHLTQKQAACCQSPPTPVLSCRDSAYCFGMCQDLLGHPHPGRARKISHLTVFLHWFSDIAVKSIRDVLSLLYLWPSKALKNLFFSPMVVQDRAVVTWRFFASYVSSPPSIFQYSAWMATVVEKKVNLIS